MDNNLYNQTAYRFARELTLGYSSSFGLGSRFFSQTIRPHIYAIYGLVRIADEIVDTYQGSHAEAMLDELEQDTYRAIRTGYSANLIVQAYALTVRAYDIDPALLKAFFKSMRMDLEPRTYTAQTYQEYIYGSAETIGLMCLRVFVNGNDSQYQQLTTGASALGAAYQKINFLRDLQSDVLERQRFYFPGHNYGTFDNTAKAAVIHDITTDFMLARPAIDKLPKSSRRAVLISYHLYSELLDRLKSSTIADIKARRIRVSAPGKLWLVLRSYIRPQAGAPVMASRRTVS